MSSPLNNPEQFKVKFFKSIINNQASERLPSAGGHSPPNPLILAYLNSPQSDMVELPPEIINIIEPAHEDRPT